MQQHLPPYGLALIEKRLGLDLVTGITRGQPLGHDELSVQERAQDPVRHQESRPGQQLAYLAGRPDVLLPVRRDEAQLLR